MAGGNKDENVSVTFHYLRKGNVGDDGVFVGEEFAGEEFEALCNEVCKEVDVDLSDPDQFDAFKYGKRVPFLDTLRVDDRTLFGRFKSAYWGHSFENSEKGKIAAQSLNIREFCFLLYFSESGDIFVAAQYLGHYGDYTSLMKTLLKILGLGSRVRDFSLYSDSEDFKNAIPAELNVTLLAKSEDIAKGNVLGKSSIVTFRKRGKDDAFELTVRDKLLALKGQPLATIKKQVAALLNENELYSVDSEDIENCTIRVRRKKGKGLKTVYLFSNGFRATMFGMDVALDDDGHPMLDAARSAMIEKLYEEVIEKLPNG